ncbi:FecR family protein [Methylomonas methanica]|uniref:Anti-FecI sigma factor, FecR n=1 Tax=Methylomonas methanica (strain DSM 25384 / MC09) TaxID=857087 RepID=G0A118_METMM|nr:FecR family protein [Methylomonas methanica]AEG01274.1 anti-FecI sigma factor, FecR [Methylomonas methanica MC09]
MREAKENTAYMSDKPSYDQNALNQALAWLLRLRDDPDNAELRQELADWIADDAANRSAFRKAEQQWEWMEQFKAQSFKARDHALRYRPSTHQRRPKPAAYAVAAVLLAGIGLALFSPQGLIGLPQHYSVGTGQRQTITLSDGSALELNTGSRVKVRFNRYRRLVEIEQGEAFFNVKHDEDRPFVVQAAEVSVTDMGTAFDVYKQAERVNVVVTEGAVEIETRHEVRELKAGGQIAVDQLQHFIQPDDADIAAATAWRQGLLVFRGRRLGEVLAEIGRYHEVQIRLPDPKLADLKVNGSFPTAGLDKLLNAVTALLPVEIKRLSETEILLQAAKRPPAG